MPSNLAKRGKAIKKGIGGTLMHRKPLMMHEV
jgi:hypothetical protein